VSDPGQHVHDPEDAPHRQLHVAGRPDFEHEARLGPSRVSDDVQTATRDGEAVPRSQLVVSSADAREERTGHHVDLLVLPKMDVSRHPTTRIQANLHPQELTIGFGAGVKEDQTLARDRVVDLAATAHDGSLVESTAGRHKVGPIAPHGAAENRA
jgi:hypothetical protein